MDAAATDVDPLKSKVARVSRRVRTQRALDGAVLCGVIGGALAVAVMSWSKLTHVGQLPWVIAAATLVPAAGALIGSVRPLPQLWAAQLIDRTHDLHDRFASAITFAQHPSVETTPFQAACIRDALQHASRVEPKRAAPFHRPPWLLAWLMSLSAVGVISLLEAPTHAAVITAPTLRPALLATDDLDAFRQAARELHDRGLSPELERSIQQLNQLLEQLANRDIDREQALRALRKLEDNLARASQADPTAVKDALGTLGKSLERAPVTKTLAKALSETDPAAAAAEIQRVAKQLRAAEISKRDLEAMRAALARAAKAREGQSREQLAQRRQELERLLQRERAQREKQPNSESDRRLLNRRQRELERLQREEQSATEQQRQLERLQRELDDAAEQLSQQENESAADALDRGAEELNRMAREQMTEQQRQQMQQQMQQLREMLRRQQQEQSGNQGKQGQGKGQRGGGQRLRLDQFTKLAQGQSGQQPGQEQQGQGQPQAPGDGTKMLTLGNGGDGEPITLEMPGMGRTTVSKQSGSGGREAGNGPGDTTRGTATSLDADHVDTRVEGEQQAGPSRSQIIEGASSDGFAARGYQKVFTEYERHAESVIERDEIPGGYRFYVRRYFQLIRPREPSR